LSVEEQSFFDTPKHFCHFFKYKNKNTHFLRQMDVKQLELNRKPDVNPKHSFDVYLLKTVYFLQIVAKKQAG
jgi:hypothetical protein